MKVRNLIELLAKKDWDSEIYIDTNIDVSGQDNLKNINSISQYTKKRKQVTTLNTRLL